MTQSLDTAVPPRPADGAAPEPGPGTGAVDPAALLGLALRLAAEPGLAGRLPVAADERTWLALPSAPGTTAWLIAWPPGTGTGWHDHGDASGAFVTIAGELTERSTEAPEPHEFGAPVPLPGGTGRVRGLAAGESRAFSPRHIHEVTNDAPVTAFSVHVYGPDLTLMRRYVPSGGQLLPVGVEVAAEW
jgi:Cysteine dioxygenase type I